MQRKKKKNEWRGGGRFRVLFIQRFFQKQQTREHRERVMDIVFREISIVTKEESRENAVE